MVVFISLNEVNHRKYSNFPSCFEYVTMCCRGINYDALWKFQNFIGTVKHQAKLEVC